MDAPFVEISYAMQPMMYSDKNPLSMYNSDITDFGFKTFWKVRVAKIYKDDSTFDY